MPESAKPHIIYILSDEHRGQAMSHAGDPNVRTPVMDRLAAEGASFTRAYANCPICTPSRGMIFSGRHAHACPVPGFFDGWKIGAPSTATVLREAGYHAAYMGKWHCGTVHDQAPAVVNEHRDEFGGQPHRTPECRRAGFQDWYGFEVVNSHYKTHIYHNEDVEPTRLEGYQTDALTDLAIDYLKQYDRDQPLFLVLSIEPPHFPIEAPGAYERFDPDALEVRPNFEGGEGMRKSLATYYAMIENLDDNIGRLRDAIDADPRFSGGKTLTTYFSDHGEFLGSHGQVKRKMHPHEESVRIPAIFHRPGHIPATGLLPPERGLFSILDMMATTLGLAGVEIPVWNQGTDFSPLLRGEAFTGPQEVFLEMCANPRWNMDFLDWRGFVNQRTKYAFYETGVEMLFDLEDDPYEMNNLVESQPERAAEARQRVLRMLDETRDPYFDVIISHGVGTVPSKNVSFYNHQSKAYPPGCLTLVPQADQLRQWP